MAKPSNPSNEIGSYYLTAWLRLDTPLHIAMPDTARYDTKTGKRVYVKNGGPDPKKGTFDLTSTNRSRVFVLPPASAVSASDIPDAASAEGRAALGEDAESDVGEQDEGTVTGGRRVREQATVEDVPSIPANSIAGQLRRHCQRVVLALLSERGMTISPQIYNVIACGAATGSPARGTPNIDEWRALRQDPYIGLMGGGPALSTRHVRVHEPMPVIFGVNDWMFRRLGHPSIADGGYCVPRGYWPGRLFGVQLFRRLSDITNPETLSETTALITGGERALREHFTAVLEAAGSDGLSKRLTVEVNSAIEFVLPGVEFLLRMQISATPAQLGLFFSAFDSFCATGRLGGWARNGFGDFTVHDAYLRTGLAPEWVAGVIDDGRLARDHHIVAPALDAWDAAKRDLSFSLLEGLLSAERPTKKPGKKGAVATAGGAEQ